MGRELKSGRFDGRPSVGGVILGAGGMRTVGGRTFSDFRVRKEGHPGLQIAAVR